MRPEFRDGRASLRGDLRQPDDGFDRLDLTEERTDGLELMMAPMLEQARCFRRHAPLVGIWQPAPSVDVGPYLVDDRGGVIFLRLGRQPLAAVEDEAGLAWITAPPLRLRNRR